MATIRQRWWREAPLDHPGRLATRVGAEAGGQREARRLSRRGDVGVRRRNRVAAHDPDQRRRSTATTKKGA
jgi:hypothetical protein